MIRVVRENLKFQSGDQTLPGSYCNRLGRYREKVPFRTMSAIGRHGGEIPFGFMLLGISERSSCLDEVPETKRWLDCRDL